MTRDEKIAAAKEAFLSAARSSVRSLADGHLGAGLRNNTIRLEQELAEAEKPEMPRLMMIDEIAQSASRCAGSDKNAAVNAVILTRLDVLAKVRELPGHYSDERQIARDDVLNLLEGK